MATVTAKPLDKAGRRVKQSSNEPPKANLLEKEVTPVMALFATYIKEQTGYDVDLQTLQLGSSLRGEFQKSEINQERINSRKTETASEAEAREARKAERVQAKAERDAARAAKAAEPKAEKVAKVPAAKKAPVAKAAPAGKKPVAKPVATTRRRPAGAKPAGF